MKAFADMWRDIGLAAMMLAGGESALVVYAAIRQTGRVIEMIQERMALIYLTHPECRDTIRHVSCMQGAGLICPRQCRFSEKIC